MNQILDKIIRYFRVHHLIPFVPKHTAAILDVGCGPRPWFFDISETDRKNLTFSGIDKRAYVFPDTAPTFDFQSTFIDEQLPYADASFDIVTMLAVLEHIMHDAQMASELYRVVKPGGFVLITVPTHIAQPILETLAFRLHLIDREEIADHKRYYNKKELRDVFIRAGFSISSIHYFELGCNLFLAAQKPRI